MKYIVKDLNSSRCLYSSVMTDFSDKPAVNFICEIGDDDARDKLTSMGINPTAFTEYREFSNEEQKAEAVRAIVTAQHEIDAMEDGGIDADYVESNGMYYPGLLLELTKHRQSEAREWLSLVA